MSDYQAAAAIAAAQAEAALDEELELEGPPTFAPGTYVGTLVGVRPVHTRWEGEERDLLGLDFAVETDTDTLQAGMLVSKSTGPKSKLRQTVEALHGAPIDHGTKVRLRDYIGRMASVTLEADKDGYPKVRSVSALPRGRS